jgi:hypothetical protein
MGCFNSKSADVAVDPKPVAAVPSPAGTTTAGAPKAAPKGKEPAPTLPVFGTISAALHLSLVKAERDARELFMTTKRKFYEWDQPDGHPAAKYSLPPGSKGLPLVEHQLIQTPVSLFDKIMSQEKAKVSNFVANTLAAIRKDPFDALDDYPKWFPLIKTPTMANRWTSDVEFGRQRVGGAHPDHIQRVTDFTELRGRFDKAELQAALPAGTPTIDELIASNRLFQTDFKDLDDVPVNPGMFLSNGTGVFWVDDADVQGEKRRCLLPLAIWLGADSTNPAGGEPRRHVFFRTDAPRTWLLAKMCYQHASFTYQETVMHLMSAHLVVEAVAMSMHRNLHPCHPLYKLLHPHTLGTIFINNLARGDLVPNIVGSLFAHTFEGVKVMVDKAWQSYDWTGRMVPNDLRRRGITDTSMLPDYDWGNDALSCWNIWHELVEAVVNHTYPTDASLAEDHELMALQKEVVKTGRLTSVPEFTTRAIVCDFLTHTIMLPTVHHNAWNFAQWEFFAWTPNAPSLILGGMPYRGMPEPTNEELFKRLPDAEHLEKQVASVFALSQPPNEGLRVVDSGKVQKDDFEDAGIKAAFDTLSVKLQALSASINARNDSRPDGFKYPFLDPAYGSMTIST